MDCLLEETTNNKPGIKIILNSKTKKVVVGTKTFPRLKKFKNIDEKHAAFYRKNDRWYIYRLTSCGIYINGELLVNIPKSLNYGDYITFGDRLQNGFRCRLYPEELPVQEKLVKPKSCIKNIECENEQSRKKHPINEKIIKCDKYEILEETKHSLLFNDGLSRNNTRNISDSTEIAKKINLSIVEKSFQNNIQSNDDDYDDGDTHSDASIVCEDKILIASAHKNGNGFNEDHNDSIKSKKENWLNYSKNEKKESSTHSSLLHLADDSFQIPSGNGHFHCTKAEKSNATSAEFFQKYSKYKNTKEYDDDGIHSDASIMCEDRFLIPSVYKYGSSFNKNSMRNNEKNISPASSKTSTLTFDEDENSKVHESKFTHPLTDDNLKKSMTKIHSPKNSHNPFSETQKDSIKSTNSIHIDPKFYNYKKSRNKSTINKLKKCNKSAFTKRKEQFPDFTEKKIYEKFIKQTSQKTSEYSGYSFSEIQEDGLKLKIFKGNPNDSKNAEMFPKQSCENFICTPDNQIPGTSKHGEIFYDTRTNYLNYINKNKSFKNTRKETRLSVKRKAEFNETVKLDTKSDRQLHKPTTKIEPVSASAEKNNKFYKKQKISLIKDNYVTCIEHVGEDSNSFGSSLGEASSISKTSHNFMTNFQKIQEDTASILQIDKTQANDENFISSGKRNVLPVENEQQVSYDFEAPISLDTSNEKTVSSPNYTKKLRKFNNPPYKTHKRQNVIKENNITYGEHVRECFKLLHNDLGEPVYFSERSNTHDNLITESQKNKQDSILQNYETQAGVENSISISKHSVLPVEKEQQVSCDVRESNSLNASNQNAVSSPTYMKELRKYRKSLQKALKRQNVIDINDVNVTYGEHVGENLKFSHDDLREPVDVSERSNALDNFIESQKNKQDAESVLMNYKTGANVENSVRVTKINVLPVKNKQQVSSDFEASSSLDASNESAVSSPKCTKQLHVASKNFSDTDSKISTTTTMTITTGFTKTQKLNISFKLFKLLTLSFKFVCFILTYLIIFILFHILIYMCIFLLLRC